MVWKDVDRVCAALLVAAVLAAALLGGATPAAGEEGGRAGGGRRVDVADPGALIAAIERANPGDEIVIRAGRYGFRGGRINVARPGRPDRPIVVRAETLGGVQILMDTLEGFVVAAPHWRFENLDLKGECADHSRCEHAFHIVGDADHTVVRNNRIRDFNAAIKGNGLPGGATWVFPDDVLIEDNLLFNTTPRDTGNPVTPIDVVGGHRWVVRGNYIADFEKLHSNQVSYGAFLKGGSRAGVFERNLIVCEARHRGGVRIGLSLGGGGTAPDSACMGGTCDPEHVDGIIRNNIIMDCPNDVGIYLNKARNTKIYNNTLHNTGGIDIRFESSSADIRNNITSLHIRDRNGGSSTLGKNLRIVSDRQIARLFADPAQFDFGLKNPRPIVDQGEPLPEVSDDFCGNPRSGAAPDLGAIEYGDGAACGPFWILRRL